jgi:hypothetical protein
VLHRVLLLRWQGTPWWPLPCVLNVIGQFE